MKRGTKSARRDGEARKRGIIAGQLSILTIILGFLNLYTVHSQRDFNAHLGSPGARECSATVSGRVVGRDNQGRTPGILVKATIYRDPLFLADLILGKEYSFGDSITLRYCPAEPDYYVTDDLKSVPYDKVELLFSGAVTAVYCAVCALVGSIKVLFSS